MGCSASYASGTTVTLTAIPEATTSVFLGWGGACTVAPCEITMNGNSAVTADFVLSPKCKTSLLVPTGFATLTEAYNAAGSEIHALVGLFENEPPLDGFLLDDGKDITLKGGYLADYVTRSGYSTLIGKLTVKNDFPRSGNVGSLRVDGLKVKP